MSGFEFEQYASEAPFDASAVEAHFEPMTSGLGHRGRGGRSERCALTHAPARRTLRAGAGQDKMVRL